MLWIKEKARTFRLYSGLTELINKPIQDIKKFNSIGPSKAIDGNGEPMLV